MKTANDIQPGQGSIINENGEDVAVYKNEDGTVMKFSAFCPHAACIVDWNGAEKTWDCPCHGSRFTADGKFIPNSGPALRDLEKK